MTRSRLSLGVLLVVALGVRLAWGLMQSANEADLLRLPDQREYLELARNLLHGDGFKFFDPRFGEDVFAHRTPGYPLFIAACGANVRAVRVAQSLLDTSTVLAVYLLARRWFSSGPFSLREKVRMRADESNDPALPNPLDYAGPHPNPLPEGEGVSGCALLAAAIVALNPFLIYFSATLLSETLFTAMLAWGMVLLVWPVRWGMLLGGLVLAMSILVKPSALFLPVLLGLAGVFANRPEASAYQRRWSVPVGTTMVALIVLVLLPWAIRNQHVLGRWVWTTTNGGISYYEGFNPGATGAGDQSFTRSMPQLNSMGEVGRSDYLAALAKEYVRENPRRVVELTGAKLARTWSPVPLSREFGQPKHRIVGLVYSLPLFVLTVVGLWRGRLPRAAKVFLLMPALYFTGVHALSVGSLRYRIPAEAPMAVVAAAGLCGLFRPRETPGGRRVSQPDPSTP